MSPEMQRSYMLQNWLFRVIKDQYFLNLCSAIPRLDSVVALGGHDCLLACPSLSRALLPQHSKTADIYSVLFWSHEPVTLVKWKKWDD